MALFECDDVWMKNEILTAAAAAVAMMSTKYKLKIK